MNEVISDPLDVASQQEQLHNEMSIKHIQKLASKPIPTSKLCLWCSSKTTDGRRWCNAECRNMHQEYGCQ